MSKSKVDKVNKEINKTKEKIRNLTKQINNLNAKALKLLEEEKKNK